jgi:anti-sigma B factor antagonist
VIALAGRLDLVSAAELRRVVADVVAGGRHDVVVDLGAVTFLDSSGLGALVAALKTARQAGGELRVAAAPEQALTVLRLTRLDRVVRPYATVDEALEGL